MRTEAEIRAVIQHSKELAEQLKKQTPYPSAICESAIWMGYAYALEWVLGITDTEKEKAE